MALYIGTPAGSDRHCHAEWVALSNGRSGSQEPEYSIKYYCDEELADGFYTLIKQNVTATREGLYRTMTNLLGFSRTGEAIVGKFDRAINILVDNRFIKKSADGESFEYIEPAASKTDNVVEEKAEEGSGVEENVGEESVVEKDADKKAETDSLMTVEELISVMKNRLEDLKRTSEIRELNDKEQIELNVSRELTDELWTVVDWMDKEKNNIIISVDDDLAADGRTIYYVKMRNNSDFSFKAFSMAATLEGSNGSSERETISCENWEKGEQAKLPFYSSIPETEARSISLDVMSIRYQK